MKVKEKKGPKFLTGGGEMGELIRSFDWSQTAIGSPETWPQSLRIAARIILDCPFGMYIAWGDEYIQLYNDGYRPILGASKHPEALGIGARKTFAEIWTTIGPMFGSVMDGTPVGYPDFVLHLDRNGYVEECVFDFSYSPIRLENGEVGGVLVTVIETTEKVNILKKLVETNDQLNFAIEATELGIWEYNPLTGKLVGNARLKEWFGLPNTAEVYLENAIEVIVEKDRRRVEEAIQKVLEFESGGLYDIEYAIKNPKDHFERIVRAKGRAWFDKDHVAYRFNGTLQDITLKEADRRKIEESEKQFRIFADSIQNLAWIADGDGWIYWYNQQWYTYTGTTIEEMQGWGWQKVHHPDHVEKVLTVSKELWKKNEPFELTFPLRRHDGEYCWFLTRAFPVTDASGAIERWIGTNTDITEQKMAEQKKDEFIGIASHEMKTPITTAKGYIELLQLSLIEENETALYASKAKQAIDRLQELVTELLDASKIQNGQLNYNLTTFDFNELVNETIESIRHSSKTHSIQKTGSFSHTITGDRDRLQQVLINLISNGIKYSPEADRVVVNIEELESEIQVSVQDFGVGMATQHLNKIFEKYYRVQEHAANFQGLGIGLYISNTIVERHNGKMWAESEPEKGSTFYFSLQV